MSKKVLIFGIISLFALTSSLFAQTIVKDDFRVNDDFTVGGSNQRMPAIAMDHQGNFVVVWLDERNTFLDIYGQRFDRFGKPRGQNFKVNNAVEVNKGIRSRLGVAMDADGDFVVVWEDYRNTFPVIYGQRYDSIGNAIGSNFRVSNYPGNTYEIDPAVAMTPSGEFVVVWKDYSNLPPSICGQRFSATGNRVGNNILIVILPFIEGLIHSSQIEMAISPDGDFIVTWLAEIYVDEIGGLFDEIHAIQVSAENKVLGSEFKVNDSDSIAAPSNPNVAMDAPGDYVIAWTEKRPESRDIFARRYNFKGEALGAGFRVNEITGQFYKSSPKIIMDPSKRFIIAWLDSRDRMPSIYFQHYNQFGEPDGNNVKAAEVGPSYPDNFEIAQAPSGRLALTWYGYGCKYDSDIFAMVVNQKGDTVKQEFRVEEDAGSSSQRNPAIAVSSSDKFTISWDDSRFCERDVFAQRFSSTGERLGFNFTVNQQTGKGRYATFSSVSMDSTGNSAISFAGNFGVYVQRYNFDGEKSGDNLFVNEILLPSGVYGQDIAMDPKGDFVVVWPQMVVASQLILGQLFTSQGNRADSNFRVNSFMDTTFYSDYPKVAKCPNGNLVVIWQNINKNIKNVEIWGQSFNSSGGRIGENFKVGDSSGNMGSYMLDVGMDREGNFVTAWSTGWNIVVQRFKADGAKIGPHIQVIDPYKTKTYNLSLAVKPDGEFMLGWEDRRNGNSDIYAQRFDSEGNPLGGNFRVNSDQGENTQMSPAVAADDKNYYFTWVDNRNSGSGFDIFAKIISFEQTSLSQQEVSGRPELSLLQNYPNPFNPSTTIPFRAGSSEQVAGRPIHTSLKIYNILGQLVRTMVDEDKMPGNYQVVWDGKNEKGQDVSSGVYFYVIKAKDFVQTRKMTLLR